jgi:folate-dependent phosphoribosylglycinamide formyltransferase PurN
MYGDHVHEKIWKDYFDGKIVSSAVTMHFVLSGIDDKMDTGPIIVQVPVSLTDCKSQGDIQKRVNALEHQIQWQITQHIINGKVTWSGVEGEPITFEE